MRNYYLSAAGQQHAPQESELKPLPDDGFRCVGNSLRHKTESAENIGCKAIHQVLNRPMITICQRLPPDQVTQPLLTNC
jgi:hypothetical protein